MELRLVLELRTGADVAREWAHLSYGGAFVPGVRAEPNRACVLLLIGPGGAELEVTGRIVYCGGDGVGVQLDGFDGARRELIQGWMQAEDLDPPTIRTVAMPTVRFGSAPAEDLDPPTLHDPPALDHEAAEEPAPEPEPASEEEDDDGADDEAPAEVKNVFQKLRNLSVVEQLRCAREGEVHERMALERIYGKTVWEALLRNPRVTHPEVARIARMGALPRPLLEAIVGNTAWLRSPEVRRALLSNLRLGADLAPRVLRLLPKHELRMVPVQTGYPTPVREAARKMIKEMEKGT